MKKFGAIIRGIIFYIKYHFFQKTFFVNGVPVFNKGSTLFIDKNSRVLCGRGLCLERYSTIKALGKSCLKIGDNCYLNQNVGIYCFNDIIVGNDVLFGPNCLVYDHDHKYDRNGVIPNKYEIGSVKIGNNVWIGANTIILKGTIIGDNCVIAAGSIIKGNIPNNTLVIQKKSNTLTEIL